MKCFATVVLTWIIVSTASAQDDSPSSSDQPEMTPKTGPNRPIEVGLVNWQRDLTVALTRSKATGKPVLVLFQEVPGCAGCQKFGREVLSHPLIVEAIEDQFLPIVVYNNRSTGRDAKLLKQFNEPAWNYQVVRFLDGTGSDIVPRKEGVWTVGGIAARMIAALQAAKRPVPKYLQSVVSISDLNHSQVAFAMSCFWTGEYELGNIDGVITTEAGWLDGREVTRVQFDEKKLTLDSLARQAANVRCANKVYTASGRSIAGLKGGKLDGTYRTASASDQKRQLSRWTELAKVPGLNAMQQTKVNSLMPRSRGQALSWLSPRQRNLIARKKFDRSR